MRKKKYNLYKNVIADCWTKAKALVASHGRIIQTQFKGQFLVKLKYSDGYVFNIDRMSGCFGMDDLVAVESSLQNYIIDIDSDNDTNTAYFTITKDGQTTRLFKLYENGNVELGDGVAIDADGNITIDGAAAFKVGTNELFHPGNDGAGSGLDADKLDGVEGAGYAVAAKGVTNGDTHDHEGGDGGQVDHVDLANKGTNTHAQIDTHVGATNPHSKHVDTEGNETVAGVKTFSSTPVGPSTAPTADYELANKKYGDDTFVAKAGDAAWHEVGAGGEPAFENSWVNLGGGYNTAAFRKDTLGFVHLKGLIKDGTITQVAFTLPAGYRPVAHQAYAAVSNAAFGQFHIFTNGQVNIAGGNNTYFSLDTAIFLAA